MSKVLRRGGGVLAAALLVLGVSGCGKGGTDAGAAASQAAGAASSVAGAASSLAGGATASDSASASVAASPSATAGDGASCKKVRFALHAGLGAGAVHRWIWKPYQAGTFATGAAGRKTAFVKAGLAGAFALHEFKVALKDIQGCQGTQAITKAVQGGLDKVTGAAAAVKAGKFDPKTVTDLNGSLSQIENAAKSGGITVTEKDPTAVQLATGNTGD